MVEETVSTQNTFAEEKCLVETEIDVGVKDLKEKKKGSVERAVILFGKTKYLINRFSQEQMKAYKIKEIGNMKAEELKGMVNDTSICLSFISTLSVPAVKNYYGRCSINKTHEY